MDTMRMSDRRPATGDLRPDELPGALATDLSLSIQDRASDAQDVGVAWSAGLSAFGNGDA